MNFLSAVQEHARTMHSDAPPIVVAHPLYGAMGTIDGARGFVSARGCHLSNRAIMRDAHRNTVRLLQRFERQAPEAIYKRFTKFRRDSGMDWAGRLSVISNYDGIVAARGNGALQDVWMAMTATQTPVTLSWYDLMNFANWSHATAPALTAYLNASTAGLVQDATTNGSWLTNPQSTNHKYIVSMGLTATSITGFALAMLFDQLWAGSVVLTTNATIAPTTPLAVTRYANTTPGNADYAGGNQLQFTLSTTLTFSVAGTITSTYTDGNGTASKTTAWIAGTTGTLLNRIVGNTTYNSATVNANTPFSSLTNAGTPGITKLQQVAISGGTMTVGTATAKIVRPLIIMPFIAANSYIEQDTTLNIGNMVELRNVSQVCGCLGWNAFSAGTTAASMSAFMRTVEG